MLSNISLIITSLGVGGLLGVFAKSIFDRRHLKFTKIFEFKERRYQAISILMLAASNPSNYAIAKLTQRRPDIGNREDLDRELEVEYNNAMLFASDAVLRRLKEFIGEKNPRKV